MRKTVAAALVAVLMASPALAGGQQAPAAPQPPASAQPPDSSSQNASPAEMGISLDRVRKELREQPPTQSHLLRYDFHVDVYGENPKVDFFKGFDLSPTGPVRYGGMTHAEFLDVTTPQAYKAPAADLIGLAVWAASQLAKKKIADRSSDKDK